MKNEQGFDPSRLLGWTRDIVAAHVRNAAMPTAELPGMIRTVHATLSALAGGAGRARPAPAVAVKRSVRPEYIVCLEDGRKLKMLKRHLRTAFDLSPAQYREKWGLPADYPMVAPNYAKTRSSLARKIGLGRGRRKSAAKK